MEKRAIVLTAALLVAIATIAAAQPGRMQVTVLPTTPVAPPPVAPSREFMECTPSGFPTLRDFNVTAYISAPWYVQQQLPLNYQPADQLYCVKAEYELRDLSTIEAGLVVNNYANKGAVNGPSVGSSKYDRSNGPRLIALPDTVPFNEVTDGKLMVGPELLLTSLPGDLWRRAFGPYWVVAVGPSADPTLQYDWAIVSGGAPVYPVAGKGCSTLSPRASSGGMGTGSSAAGQGVGAAVAYGGARAGYDGAAGVYGGPTTGAYGGSSVQLPGAAPSVGRSGLTTFDKGGLWLLSRQPVDPDTTTAMRNLAQQMGLDISGLLPVAQEGCRYEA